MGQKPNPDVRPLELFMCSVVMRQGQFFLLDRESPASKTLIPPLCFLRLIMSVERWLTPFCLLFSGYGEGFRWLAQFV